MKAGERFGGAMSSAQAVKEGWWTVWLLLMKSAVCMQMMQESDANHVRIYQ